MLFLAVSALDKMKAVPPRIWLYVAGALIGFIVFVLVLQRLARVNKLVLGIVAVVTCALLFFNWVYNRNEPAFLTPFVDRIAPFFPSRGAYAKSQQMSPTDEKSKPPPAKQQANQQQPPPSHVY